MNRHPACLSLWHFLPQLTVKEPALGTEADQVNHRHSRRATRLFFGAAAVSIVPVLVIGLSLAMSYRSETTRRGLAEGRSEAELIAQTAIAPALGAGAVDGKLSAAQRSRLALVAPAEAEHDRILRLRVRSLEGRVIFSNDGSGLSSGIDDEAAAAGAGGPVAELTHLNSDGNDAGPRGVAAVEVYVPVLDQSTRQPVAVLEVYLPYAPIKASVDTGVRTLFRNMLIALAALYIALFVISWRISRGLRREADRNADLATYDALTGLRNRRAFAEHLKELVAKTAIGGRRVAIAVLDVDRFNEVNNAFGRRNGDTLLREVARRLTEEAHCDAARLGADEFGLAFSDAENIETELERIRAIVTREFVIDGVPLAVSANLGYAIAPDDGEATEDLVQRADLALRAVKGRPESIGRYDADSDTFDPDNLPLMTELRSAIDAGDLVLHYQPKARLADDVIDSIEALVRWNHATRGLLPPDRFIPLSEQSDLIDDLTDWVLARALADLQQLRVDTIGLAINVSARSLGRADFPDRILRALGHAQVDPTRLTLEITETALLSDPHRAAIALSQLDAFGVKISIDDFGIGQTSLRLLTTLPIDELKIDRMFVSDMVEDPGHAAIVRSIIELGHNLNLRVVAEGIENEHVMSQLRDLECDTAQGFYLARPMPIGDLPRYLSVVKSNER
jgi:diguanylate cyclase (GGDEF)-like protein